MLRARYLVDVLIGFINLASSFLNNI